jgi:hypothetical protein
VSLSIAGRSSWTSEYVWIISIAQAAGSAAATAASAARPPEAVASAAARTSIGRNRFPPANTL